VNLAAARDAHLTIPRSILDRAVLVDVPGSTSPPEKRS
jgi:hypothetical protein